MSVGREVCMHVSGGHARCGVFCVYSVRMHVKVFFCLSVCMYVCIWWTRALQIVDFVLYRCTCVHGVGMHVLLYSVRGCVHVSN